jgi:hypothetical protein
VAQRANQAAVWSEVHAKAARMRSFSPTDAAKQQQPSAGVAHA